MLTARQREILFYIAQCQSQDGVTPSYDEMCNAIGIKSKSGIYQLISALIERGYLKKLHNRARSLEIIKLPEGGASTGQATKNASHQNSTDLPFLGRVAAGRAIEAIAYVDETISIPNSLIGKGEYFVLEVAGDSMIEAGIFDGDYVIIKRQITAYNGSIVVACIDQEEVTLKTLQMNGDSIALKPENEAYQPQIFGASRIEIKGVLSGLVRRY